MTILSVLTGNACVFLYDMVHLGGHVRLAEAPSQYVVLVAPGQDVLYCKGSATSIVRADKLVVGNTLCTVLLLCALFH